MLYSEVVPNQSNPKFSKKEDGWEVYEYSPIKRTGSVASFEELWINRITNKQQVVKRVIRVSRSM